MDNFNAEDGLKFTRSSRCVDANDCVEVARLKDGRIAIRLTSISASPALIATDNEWRAFVSGVKLGDFDQV